MMLEEELYQWLTYAPYLSATAQLSAEGKVRSLLAEGIDVNYRQGHCYHQYYINEKESVENEVEDAPCLLHQLVDSNWKPVLELFLALGSNAEAKNQVRNYHQL